MDAPDNEAQAKPVAPTPSDATPSKGYVKMKARKTIEAERAALLASQQPPQPPAEDKAPACSVCSNPVNLFSPDGVPFAYCSQCVRTSSGAPIKCKRPELDPPQELKKRRDPDQDGDAPPQGPASSQAAASLPQASAPAQQSTSGAYPATSSAPTSTGAQDALAVGLRRAPGYRAPRPSSPPRFPLDIPVFEQVTPDAPRAKLPRRQHSPNTYYATIIYDDEEMRCESAYWANRARTPSPSPPRRQRKRSTQRTGREEEDKAPGAAQPKPKVSLGHLLMMVANGDLEKEEELMKYLL